MTQDVVEVTEVLPHPQERLWAVVGHVESYPRFVREISWCGPTSSGPPRAGRRYDVRFSLDDGPVRRDDVELLVHRAPERLVLVSPQWSGGHLAVSLNPLDSERTELRVTIALPHHQSPTTVTGKWLRKRARRAVRLVDDHLAGVPATTPIQGERMDQPRNGQPRVRVSRVLTQAGMLSPRHPGALLRQLTALARRDPTVAGGYRASVALAPRKEALSDDRNMLTFADIDDRTNRLANALTQYGVRRGRRVALLCRNHAALVESVIACGKLGAEVLLLDTDLTATQATEAIHSYSPVALLVDDELLPQTSSLPPALPRISTWGTGTPTVEQLIAQGTPRRVKAPPNAGKIIALRSGTAANPKGSHRRNPYTLRMIAALLSRIPLREGERMLVAAPLFHSWAGVAAMQLGMPLHANLLLRRHLDARQTLRLIEKHRCTSLFTTPGMLEQIVNLPREVIRGYDTTSLRVIASSGPSMSSQLVAAVTEEFGEVLYNLYGSTEVSWTSVADPRQLRAAPTTAGRPPPGTRVEILDDQGHPVPPGAVGRIWVGDDVFRGYSGRPTGKLDNLRRSGDQGYTDANGRLFVVNKPPVVLSGQSTFPGQL